MARIRTIKPEFPQSESLGRVSRDARLLFILLWPICDDHGRTRAASRMLASLLFPYDEDSLNGIEGWLDELEREGCIRRYEVDGTSYLEIPNWLKHQKIDKPSKPQFPSFAEGSPKPREASRTFVVGREGKGMEGRESAPAPLPQPSRPQPLVTARRRDAAYEGPRGLYVPQRLHSQFIGNRNHANAERELLAWYERVCVEWSTGSRSAEQVDPNMFKFWEARFREEWPPAGEGSKVSTLPRLRAGEVSGDLAKYVTTGKVVR